MRGDAFEEGVGHAIVGMFFGRNLIYLIDQQHATRRGAGTVAGGARDSEHKGDVLAPDMEEWLQRGIDEAWCDEATATAALPLLRADKFSVRDRLKSWALCDYLLRRDPDLLRGLDEAGEGQEVRGDIEAAFRDREGFDIASVEEDWRRFLAGGHALARRDGAGGARPAQARRAPRARVVGRDQRRAAQLGARLARMGGPSSARSCATMPSGLRTGLANAAPAKVHDIVGHVLLGRGASAAEGRRRVARAAGLPARVAQRGAHDVRVRRAGHVAAVRLLGRTRRRFRRDERLPAR